LVQPATRLWQGSYYRFALAALVAFAS
jgi:hypothetical protein